MQPFSSTHSWPTGSPGVVLTIGEVVEGDELTGVVDEETVVVGIDELFPIEVDTVVEVNDDEVPTMVVVVLSELFVVEVVDTVVEVSVVPQSVNLLSSSILAPI